MPDKFCRNEVPAARIGSTAEKSSEFVRRACAEFRSKANYGYGNVGALLQRIVAQIGAANIAAFGHFVAPPAPSSLMVEFG